MKYILLHLYNLLPIQEIEWCLHPQKSSRALLNIFPCFLSFPGGPKDKNPPVMQETQVPSLRREDKCQFVTFLGERKGLFDLGIPQPSLVQGIK